jgi:hypothetical protein
MADLENGLWGENTGKSTSPSMAGFDFVTAMVKVHTDLPLNNILRANPPPLSHKSSNARRQPTYFAQELS